MNENKLAAQINKLTEIGISLSTEKDSLRLLESILVGAKELTNADAGSLYTAYDDDAGNRMIRLDVLQTDSLGIHQGGTSEQEISIQPIPLVNEDGTENLSNVVSYCINCSKTVNIEDAYNHKGFDFEGMRKIADELNYHPQSFLTVPMKNHMGEIIGVLQLINAMSEETGEIIKFSLTAQELVESLASQAAIALTNQQLINEQKNLMESIIQLVATAIDDKSPYTGDHCRRVPVLTMMLADAAHNARTGSLKSFHMSDDDRYELEIAAWLHDCGKITTPEFVIDKGTKLETIHDRISEIDTRFEILKRDAEITLIRDQLNKNAYDTAKLDEMIAADLDEMITKYDEDLAFIRAHNTGGEFMADEDIKKIEEISHTCWTHNSETVPLLSGDEVYNLSIQKGTLTPEEREIINHHIVATINMLKSLPFPKHLRNVPEFAGGHHERMDGKGYPKGLTREQMSVQARVMGIADIFEALTARDRPYKKGKTLTEALRILGFMREEHHIDPDLFQLFVDERIFQTYANEYMNPEQIDEVDLEKVPGYNCDARYQGTLN